MDPRAGDYRTQARYFAGRAVLDGAALTEAQEQLARAVLWAGSAGPSPIEVVLLAGLPPYNIRGGGRR